MNFIRKAVLFILLFTVIVNKVKADEGMWIPMLIGKNYKDMKKHGLKLSKDDLYSIKKSSLKDAIILFNGYCTGEVVSDNGLILTNHHCGYDAIASKSTTQNNILDNGFWAKNHSEEISTDLYVSFLIDIQDVTDRINESIVEKSEKSKEQQLSEVINIITSEAKQNGKYDAVVKNFFNNNQYLLIISERFNDVRLVGTPPQSVGKFGGETDNWMWPRHTGDFAMFRIYADNDNKPARYSADNKPFVPRKALSVSLKGVKEGDYSMIYGYPGNTNRYATSYEVKLAIDSVNLNIVKLREIRLNAWKSEMNKSDSIRLLLTSNYARIANYWKYYIGQTEQLKRLNVVDKKQKEEQEFNDWASSKPEYKNILPSLEQLYSKNAQYAKFLVYYTQGISATSVFQLANRFSQLEISTNDIQKYKTMSDEYFKTFNFISDKEIFNKTLVAFYEDIVKNQHPDVLAYTLSKYPNKDNYKENFASYVENSYNTSIFTNKERMNAFLMQPNVETLRMDPIYLYYKSFYNTYNDKIKPIKATFDKEKDQLTEVYMEAIIEKNGSKLIYPNANMTMRITYGNIESYSSKDSIPYSYYTTIDGVMAKYKKGDEEFDLPERYIELYNKKDFGVYADKNNELVVCFISNNDITGGNSGSPVLNAKGELIGIAFDGNWEAMSGDIAFDPEYKRTISCDIRYVLWCIDKLGNAPHIIEEMNIVK